MCVRASSLSFSYSPLYPACAGVCVFVSVHGHTLSLSLFLLNSPLSWAIYHGAQVQTIVGYVIFSSFLIEVVHSQIGESLSVSVLRTCDS